MPAYRCHGSPSGEGVEPYVMPRRQQRSRAIEIDGCGVGIRLRVNQAHVEAYTMPIPLIGVGMSRANTILILGIAGGSFIAGLIFGVLLMMIVQNAL